MYIKVVGYRCVQAGGYTYDMRGLPNITVVHITVPSPHYTASNHQNTYTNIGMFICLFLENVSHFTSIPICLLLIFYKDKLIFYKD